MSEPSTSGIRQGATDVSEAPRVPRDQKPGAEVAPAVVERAKRGDEAAFMTIVRHYDPGLRSLAFRLLRDPHRMDDALQEAYVKAFRSLPRFRGESRLGTWLYRIAYNACLDELGAARRVTPLSLESVAERPDPQMSVHDSVASRSDLAAALERLPVEERAAVLLVDAQGFAYRDAAEILDVPEGTVASRLSRARAQLRTALEDRAEGAGGR
jgi:RNA polymerase sigma-70 factor (ECF subfamily)